MESKLFMLDGTVYAPGPSLLSILCSTTQLFLMLLSASAEPNNDGGPIILKEHQVFGIKETLKAWREGHGIINADEVCMARLTPYSPSLPCCRSCPLLIANVLRPITYLCWQMGMGKTLQGAGALRCIMEATSPDAPCRCLVVAPRSTLPDWESALIKTGASAYVESACLVGLVFPRNIHFWIDC